MTECRNLFWKECIITQFTQKCQRGENEIKTLSLTWNNKRGSYNQLPQQYIIKKPQERAQRVDALTKRIDHAKGHMPHLEQGFKNYLRILFLPLKIIWIKINHKYHIHKYFWLFLQKFNMPWGPI